MTKKNNLYHNFAQYNSYWAAWLPWSYPSLLRIIFPGGYMYDSAKFDILGKQWLKCELTHWVLQVKWN